jgi:hypothetical protein
MDSDIKDLFAVRAGFFRPSEAKEKGLRIRCQEPAAEHNHTDAGRREYQISGICEECFDMMFEQDE